MRSTICQAKQKQCLFSVTVSLYHAILVKDIQFCSDKLHGSNLGTTPKRLLTHCDTLTLLVINFASYKFQAVRNY